MSSSTSTLLSQTPFLPPQMGPAGSFRSLPRNGKMGGLVSFLPRLAWLLLVAPLFCWSHQAALLAQDAAQYEGATAAGWREKLSDPSEEIRRRACYALGRIRPVEPASVDALVA